MTVPQISLEHEHSLAVVTLRRAEARNALDEATLRALIDAVTRVASSGARGHGAGIPAPGRSRGTPALQKRRHLTSPRGGAVGRNR